MTQCHIWIGEVTSVHLWQQGWGTDRLQAICTNLEEVNCGSQPFTSMTLVLTGKVWCRTELPLGQRQYYCWCPQPCQSTETQGSRLWFNTKQSHHIRSLSNGILIRKSEGGNTSWPSTQSNKTPDIPRMARCEEKCSRKHSTILELERWTSSRRWVDI